MVASLYVCVCERGCFNYQCIEKQFWHNTLKLFITISRLRASFIETFYRIRSCNTDLNESIIQFAFSSCKPDHFRAMKIYSLLWNKPLHKKISIWTTNIFFRIGSCLFNSEDLFDCQEGAKHQCINVIKLFSLTLGGWVSGFVGKWVWLNNVE
jgi:hypothetical protein